MVNSGPVPIIKGLWRVIRHRHDRQTSAMSLFYHIYMSTKTWCSEHAFVSLTSRCLHVGGSNVRKFSISGVKRKKPESFATTFDQRRFPRTLPSFTSAPCKEVFVAGFLGCAARCRVGWTCAAAASSSHRSKRKCGTTTGGLENNNWRPRGRNMMFGSKKKGECVPRTHTIFSDKSFVAWLRILQRR